MLTTAATCCPQGISLDAAKGEIRSVNTLPVRSLDTPNRQGWLGAILWALGREERLPDIPKDTLVGAWRTRSQIRGVL